MGSSSYQDVDIGPQQNVAIDHYDDGKLPPVRVWPGDRAAKATEPENSHSELQVDPEHYRRALSQIDTEASPTSTEATHKNREKGKAVFTSSDDEDDEEDHPSQVKKVLPSDDDDEDHPSQKKKIPTEYVPGRPPAL